MSRLYSDFPPLTGWFLWLSLVHMCQLCDLLSSFVFLLKLFLHQLLAV